MALQKRERNLAILTVALAAVLVVWLLVSGSGGSLGTLRTRRNALQAEVDRKNTQVSRGRKARQRLARWQKRSLPANHETARTLYQNWLREVVDRAGLQGVSIDSSDGQTWRGVYTMFPFTIQARGTLKELTVFLHAFYSAGYLHKVSRLSITPMEGSSRLVLVISIQALSLPGAEASGELPSEPGDRLRHELSDYLATIVRRQMEGERFMDSGGVFAAYVPYRPPPPDRPTGPPPTAPPKPPAFDATRLTFVNAIIEENGRRQVWLFVRTTGDTKKCYEGDTFEIGEVQGKIAKIGEREVEVEIDGQLHVVGLGDPLREEEGATSESS